MGGAKVDSPADADAHACPLSFVQAAMSEETSLELETLFADLPGLPLSFASLYYEALLICLEYHAHASGVEIAVYSLDELLSRIGLSWSGSLDDRIRRAWGAPRQCGRRRGDCHSVFDDASAYRVHCDRVRQYRRGNRLLAGIHERSEPAYLSAARPAGSIRYPGLAAREPHFGPSTGKTGTDRTVRLNRLASLCYRCRV